MWLTLLPVVMGYRDDTESYETWDNKHIFLVVFSLSLEISRKKREIQISVPLLIPSAIDGIFVFLQISYVEILTPI